MIRWCFLSALLVALGSGASMAAPVAKGASARAAAVRMVEIRPRHRFNYSYPASASAIPALARVLRKEARKALADLREQARIPDPADRSHAYYPMTFDQ